MMTSMVMRVRVIMRVSMIMGVSMVMGVSVTMSVSVIMGVSMIVLSLRLFQLVAGMLVRPCFGVGLPVCGFLWIQQYLEILGEETIPINLFDLKLITGDIELLQL